MTWPRILAIRAELWLWDALGLRKTGDRIGDAVLVVLARWPDLTDEEIALVGNIQPTFKVSAALDSLAKTRLVERNEVWRVMPLSPNQIKPKLKERSR